MDSFTEILHLSRGQFCIYSITAVTAIVISGSFLWIFIRRGCRLKPIVDLNNQTRLLQDGSRVAGFLPSDELKSFVYDDVRTAYDAIFRGLRVSHNGSMLGYRKKRPDGFGHYAWLTYREVIQNSDNLAHGLYSVGVRPGQNTYIGLYAKNCPKWVISEYAIYKLNGVVVPLYDTLGAQSLHYIIVQCDLKTVICDTSENAKVLIQSADQHANLKRIVVMNALDESVVEAAKQNDIEVLQFERVQKHGEQQLFKPDFEKPKPEDVCTVCFTSGTTGTPKGVIITHGNLVATVCLYYHFKLFTQTPDQILFSLLPLAHMYERVCENAAFQIGGRVGYYSGNVRNFISDVRALKPTVLAVVPRVLNRIHDTASEFKLFYMIYRLYYCNDTLADKIVFKKIRKMLGGNLRLILCGAAPLSEDVLRFSRAALGCIVIEGYGQTECVAACTSNVEADFTTGHVGIPLLNTSIKLVDAADIGYFAKDNVGEVCVRGPSVFKGYFKNADATKEALDEDGWLHTGDIGKWNKNGTLKIIDRKKFIFKLQQGEYIAPEKIEGYFVRSLYVSQAFVYGESLKSSLVAIVVPDEPMLTRLAAHKLGLKNIPFEELCLNKAIEALVMSDMNEIAKIAGLCSFECVKAIRLSAEQFTIENGLLTPTYKNKRTELKKRFLPQITEMYTKLK